jgi:hypothetical protein
MMHDMGFESRYTGWCVVCKERYMPGDRLATAPQQYWIVTQRKTMSYGHASCVNSARAAEEAAAQGR